MPLRLRFLDRIQVNGVGLRRLLDVVVAEQLSVLRVHMSDGDPVARGVVEDPLLSVLAANIERSEIVAAAPDFELDNVALPLDSRMGSSRCCI